MSQSLSQVDTGSNCVSSCNSGAAESDIETCEECLEMEDPGVSETKIPLSVLHCHLYRIQGMSSASHYKLFQTD